MQFVRKWVSERRCCCCCCCCWCRHEKLRCRYSDIAEGERGNYCVYAHSADELEEWKMRYQWRQMKKQMARERHLYSYMDTLVDDIAAATASAGHSPVVCTVLVWNWVPAFIGLVLGVKAEFHLCRMAGNTVWSNMAREFPQRCGKFTNWYSVYFTSLTLPSTSSTHVLFNNL